MAAPSQAELQTKLAQLGWNIELGKENEVSQLMDGEAIPLRQLATAALRISADAEEAADPSGLQGKEGTPKDEGLGGGKDVETYKVPQRHRRVPLKPMK
ncbi:uncharacterized protein Dana_GF21250 [Drosophila ananassae]|uniref:Uncharacterized protein n=1 Tax=Drosophila ananassae TaxID=7217 RepID=B3MRB6_DROAN|nr:uncharacterized protein Dana_GF21250 [Drosophila ananassae]